MTRSGKSGAQNSSAIAERNKQVVLNYIDALQRQDVGAIEAALSKNFRFIRLNDRLARFEYLDALTLAVLSQNRPVFDVTFIAAEGDSVSVELALEFDFEGRRMKGQYNTLYVIEDGEIYEMREYGGIPQLSG